MTENKRIERMQQSLQRARETADALMEENTKLKQQLEYKEQEIRDLNTANENMQRRMEKMIVENGEAVEAAYEARMAYEDAEKGIRDLIKQYKDEMKQWLTLRKKID